MASLRMERATEALLERTQQRLTRAGIRLEALNPTRVLERGYVLVQDGDRTVTRAADAPEKMTLRFADGRIQVRREE